MKLHQVPFGDAAFAVRKDIYRAAINKAGDSLPRDFKNVLHLVPNERTTRFLRPLFLDVLEDETGARGCLPP